MIVKRLILVACCIPTFLLLSCSKETGQPTIKGDTSATGCRMECFGNEPSGTWVTVSTWVALNCGGASRNQSCLEDVKGWGIGTTKYVCRRSHIPEGWVIQNSSSSAACGEFDYNTVLIKRIK